MDIWHKSTGAYCPKTVFAAYSLLDQFQSAYRKCHSTETTLLHEVNYLLQASDSDCMSMLSLLDLLAAFDTVDYSILITRLHVTFGCSSMVLDWFISYLSCLLASCLWCSKGTCVMLMYRLFLVVMQGEDIFNRLLKISQDKKVQLQIVQNAVNNDTALLAEQG